MDNYIIRGHLGDFFLSFFRCSEDVMVTAGATQGLHLVSTVMFDKSTPVFMEDPSYFIALKMLKEDFGMNIIPSITLCIFVNFTFIV